MFKFAICFHHPANPIQFEGAYTDFLALVERMPQLTRRQVVHILGSPQGQAPYYRTLELYYDHETAFRESMLSPAGQEAGNELARFGTEAYDLWYGEVYEEAGGSTPTSE